MSAKDSSSARVLCNCARCSKKRQGLGPLQQLRSHISARQSRRHWNEDQGGTLEGQDGPSRPCVPLEEAAAEFRIPLATILNASAQPTPAIDIPPQLQPIPLPNDVMVHCKCIVCCHRRAHSTSVLPVTLSVCKQHLEKNGTSFRATMPWEPVPFDMPHALGRTVKEQVEALSRGEWSRDDLLRRTPGSDGSKVIRIRPKKDFDPAAIPADIKQELLDYLVKMLYSKVEFQWSTRCFKVVSSIMKGSGMLEAEFKELISNF